jgi:hypothetical protein
MMSRNKVLTAIALILAALILLQCNVAPAFVPTATSYSTYTPYPTYTPAPTYTPYPTYTPLPPPSATPEPTNVALNKPVVITLSNGWDSSNGTGVSPDDVTDGSLEYSRASQQREDGSVGYVNIDYSQTSNVVITIDLQGRYVITKIRYNMGNVERAETWGADKMVTSLGESTITPGTSYTGSTTGAGAWTEITGNRVASEVTIRLQKTRTSTTTDWLFIGEIEIYGIPAPSP